MPIYNPPSTAGLISGVNVSAGTSSAVLSALTFSNSNGVSFGLNGSVLTGTVQTNYLTTAMASDRGSDFVQAAAAFAGTSASGTIGSGGISVSIGPYITTARASTDAVGLNTALTANGVAWTVNSSGVSLNIPAFLTTAMQSASSSVFAKTGFTTTTIAGAVVAGTHDTDGLKLAVPAYLTTAMASNRSSDFVQATAAFAGTNASGTIASNGISVSVAAPGGGDAIRGIAANGSTASTNTVLFSNANGVSFGFGAAGNSTVITASHNALTTAALSDHSHGNPTLNLTNLSGTTASASNGFTLSLSAAAPGAGAGATHSEWCPYPELGFLTASGLGQNSLYFNPIDVQEHLNAYRLNMFLSVSTQISASNNTKSGGYTLSLCLYQRGAGANTERLESILSRSAYISFTASSHTRIQYDHPAGILNSTAVSQSSTSGAATNTSTYGVSSVGGYRVLPFPISSTLSPGRYWIAFANSSTSANAQGVMNCSVVQQTHASNIAYMPFGTASKASNASWPHAYVGRGLYSATSGAFPATVALSTDHIRQTAVTVVMPFFNVSGYTTATNQP